MAERPAFPRVPGRLVPMLLRLLPVALLAVSLFVVAAPADATCAGVGDGTDCTGAYVGCDLQGQLFVCLARAPPPYVCVGIYDGTCTGVQKP